MNSKYATHANRLISVIPLRNEKKISGKEDEIDLRRLNFHFDVCTQDKNVNQYAHVW